MILESYSRGGEDSAMEFIEIPKESERFLKPTAPTGGAAGSATSTGEFLLSIKSFKIHKKINAS